MAVRQQHGEGLTAAGRAAIDLEKIELDCLLEAVYRRYGFDFREYAPASLRRRVNRRVKLEGLPSISALQDHLLRDPDVMNRLLLDLSINVTAMFRDPTFYLAFREKVVPLLRTYPFTRIWVAGCSTGEEVYSLAILLEEESLYDRSRIYATDINEEVLERARLGVFPLAKMQEYTRNYIGSGGSARSPTTTSPPTTARLSTGRSCATSCSRSTTSRRPVVQRVQRDRLPQRDDLLRTQPAAARVRALRRQPGAARNPRARPQGVAPDEPHMDKYKELDTAERLYRKLKK